MSPSPKPESAIRRLFRESELRQRSMDDDRESAPAPQVDEHVATTIDRLERASAEMDRLRDMATAQRGQVGSLTSAVSRSFDREDRVVALRVVA